MAFFSVLFSLLALDFFAVSSFEQPAKRSENERTDAVTSVVFFQNISSSKFIIASILYRLDIKKAMDKILKKKRKKLSLLHIN
ncbi:hypothetical protein MAQA_09996 [Listeria aquatica FSL S10-1188]|uniref:Uncharacterized protein n=1 Tax=Listeria aquatica FSL S10-1188 TaxID=1265818 RepID=W7AWP1_9LIST|nr:hypothetical protein MAQA_09996 [Listeria aquatica FSL S10-1188]